jgi:hypothetical protein
MARRRLGRDAARDPARRGEHETIRVGAGGIMLPNHAPLVIAEQFGTLATLFPGRVGPRAGPGAGTDMLTARALRRHMAPRTPSRRTSWSFWGFLSKDAGGRAGAGGARGGDRGAGVDPGLVALWGAARGVSGAALCLRLALRADASGGGAGGVSGDVPAVAVAGGAACDGGDGGLRGPDGRGGGMAALLAGDGLCAAADGQAGEAAAAGASGRGAAGGAGDGPGGR